MAGPITKFDRAHELQRRMHDLIPGGGHTYSKGEDQFPYDAPQVIARGEGAYCWDVDGNRFLDWAMGNRVIVLGHGHPAVERGRHAGRSSWASTSRGPASLEYELAEYLVDLLPCAEMVKFGKNGSDVTTAAVKLARAVHRAQVRRLLCAAAVLQRPRLVHRHDRHEPRRAEGGARA